MLGFNFNLMDQLAFYGAYHKEVGNQVVHFVFVPLILWSAATWLAYIPTSPLLDLSPQLQFLPPALAQSLLLNGPFWLLLSYTLYYISLEPVAGTTWGLFQALPTWVLANWFRQHVHMAWLWAFALHAMSWGLQVHVGHLMIEKRRPALLDSFFQSLVLAPLFAWFEGLFFLGYRPQLKKRLDAVIKSRRDEWERSKPKSAKGGKRIS